MLWGVAFKIVLLLRTCRVSVSGGIVFHHVLGRVLRLVFRIIASAASLLTQRMLLHGLVSIEHSLLSLIVIRLVVCNLFSLFAAKFVAVLNLP